MVAAASGIALVGAAAAAVAWVAAAICSAGELTQNKPAVAELDRVRLCTNVCLCVPMYASAQWRQARSGAPTALAQLNSLLGSAQHLVDTLVGASHCAALRVHDMIHARNTYIHTHSSDIDSRLGICGKAAADLVLVLVLVRVRQVLSTILASRSF